MLYLMLFDLLEMVEEQLVQIELIPYGKKGSGKSSVVEVLRGSMEKKEEPIPDLKLVRNSDSFAVSRMGEASPVLVVEETTSGAPAGEKFRNPFREAAAAAVRGLDAPTDPRVLLQHAARDAQRPGSEAPTLARRYDQEAAAGHQVAVGCNPSVFFFSPPCAVRSVSSEQRQK